MHIILEIMHNSNSISFGYQKLLHTHKHVIPGVLLFLLSFGGWGGWGGTNVAKRSVFENM